MYQALYRKYRPNSFEDVMGQKTVVNTLKNAVIHNHINHAYLFSGPRGTGKTTVAKIFARLVNCMDSFDGVVCGKCKNCNYSFSKECMDIIEIDAASNNGVDEIRELRSKVNILPTELKYKVYIIDEVHMLSIGAFNALLKTIEEPPEHVIFILATTDPQKIPSTIISRCQWYAFKKIADNYIVERLKYIVNEEKIVVDDKVLEKIAQSADGGLRDAIGMLDKLWTYSDSKITLNDFYEINGQINDELLKKFEKMIFKKEVKEVLFNVEKFYSDGKNLVQIIKQLMLLIKEQLFDYYIEGKSLLYEEMDMVNFLNFFNEKIVDIKKADDVKLSVEILLLNYINSIKLLDTNDDYDKKIENSELPLKKNTKYINKLAPNLEMKKDEKSNIEMKNKFSFEYEKLMLIRSKNTMIKATKTELNNELENISKLNAYTFDQNCGYLACELLDGKVRASSEESIIISYDYNGMIEKMSNHFDKLNSYYNEVTNNSKKIAFITTSSWEDLKKEFIYLKQNGKQFVYEKEPVLNIEFNNDKIIKETDDDLISKTVEMFGDIVEIQ